MRTREWTGVQKPTKPNGPFRLASCSFRKVCCRCLRPAAVGFLLLPAAASGRVIDSVVATVDEEIVTRSELDETVETFTRQLQKDQNRTLEQDARDSLTRRALEELIDRKLMDARARELGISATEEEINRAIDDVIGRANITREQLQEALANDGIRYEEYRGQIRNQIVKARVMHREVSAEIDIKEAEIESYYLDHPEEFRSEKGVLLRHILIPLAEKPSPEQVEAARQQASQIRRQIQAGLSFDEAALRYSKDPSAKQGGRLGFFRAGDLSPEMENAVAGLEEGKVSEPVRSPRGIHILLVQEKTTGELRPLEKVKDQIREKLYEEAAERQFEEWRKELRKNAHVEIFL